MLVFPVSFSYQALKLIKRRWKKNLSNSNLWIGFLNRFVRNFKLDKLWHNRKALLIPLKDIEEKLHSIQFLYQENGRFLKRFLQGGKKQGHFHLIGTINENCLICITEGYATGASWHQATFHPIVVAFDSQTVNLPLFRRWKVMLRQTKTPCHSE